MTDMVHDGSSGQQAVPAQRLFAQASKWVGIGTCAMTCLVASVAWADIRTQHPTVDLDFSGELEDIEESLSAMQVLFLLGVGLIYLILAGRRRVVPILITTSTTIGGLFSLAFGIGGQSLLWGLFFSTVLTLFVVPLLYKFFMKTASVV